MRYVSFLGLIIVVGLAIACGGGGGGGDGDPDPVPVATAATESMPEFLKTWIGQNAQGNVSSAGSGDDTVASYLSKPQKVTTTKQRTGVFTITIQDETVYLWGLTIRYYSGSETVKFYDFAGALTDDPDVVNRIDFTPSNLDLSITDGTNVARGTINGTMILTGLYVGDTLTLSSSGITISNGTYNSESFAWSGSFNWAVSTASYPYPTASSSESGRLTIGNSYWDYTVSANGTDSITVNVSTTSETFYVDLDTGDILAGAQSSQTETISSYMTIKHGQFITEFEDAHKDLKAILSAEGQLRGGRHLNQYNDLLESHLQAFVDDSVQLVSQIAETWIIDKTAVKQLFQDYHDVDIAYMQTYTNDEFSLFLPNAVSETIDDLTVSIDDMYSIAILWIDAL